MIHFRNQIIFCKWQWRHRLVFNYIDVCRSKFVTFFELRDELLKPLFEIVNLKKIILFNFYSTKGKDLATHCNFYFRFIANRILRESSQEISRQKIVNNPFLTTKLTRMSNFDSVNRWMKFIKAFSFSRTRKLCPVIHVFSVRTILSRVYQVFNHEFKVNIVIISVGLSPWVT